MRKLRLEELERISVEEFQQRPKVKVVLILDNIRSALNVGSAFRTADAFALEEVILCGITAQPPHREILKSAIGATESVSWSYFEAVDQAIEIQQSGKVSCFGVEQTTTSLPLQDFAPPPSSIALVFGNEVDGISQSILPKLDGFIEIPQFGTKHSLNVSVCVGIVVWDILTKIGFPK